jgi:hypothetical protein
MPHCFVTREDVQKIVGPDIPEEMIYQFLDDHTTVNVGLDKHWAEQVKDAFLVWLSHKHTMYTSAVRTFNAQKEKETESQKSKT